MPPRKPKGQDWEDFVGSQIREAQDRGLFDDLPGEGEPLADLEEAEDPLWWAKKLVLRENVEVLPPALEVRRKVERFREELSAYPSERMVREACGALNQEIGRLNRYAHRGPPTSQALLDEEELVATWRERRADAGEEP